MVLKMFFKTKKSLKNQRKLVKKNMVVNTINQQMNLKH